MDPWPLLPPFTLLRRGMVQNYDDERRARNLLPPSSTLQEQGYIEGRLIRKKRRREWYQLAIKETPRTMCQDIWLPTSQCPQLFLESVVRIFGCSRQKAEDDEEEGVQAEKWLGSQVELVLCASNPIATKTLLDDDTLHLDYLKSVLLPPDAITETAQRLESLLLADEPITPSQNAWIVRVLDGRENDPKRSTRPPKISRKEKTALDCMEAAVEPFPISYRALPPVLLHLPVHLSDQDEKSRRLLYLRRKKHPQISWMVHRLELMFKNQQQQPPNHITDVGGGRGDLARAIAVAFPTTTVTVVDVNASSLAAGREWCAAVPNMRFVQADFRTIAPDPSVDVVVALHACGVLSDLALQYADACDADFCVCPCCYTKMQQQDDTTKGLLRLAELNHGCQSLPRRARLLINSKRLRNLESRYETVALEEFDQECSMRNMVMVGNKRSIL